VNSKAYVLFEALDGKCESIVQALQGKPGVVVVDKVEGPPDVVMVVEAPNRRRLAKRVISALASVENITEGFNLLPACDDVVPVRGRVPPPMYGRRVNKNPHPVHRNPNVKSPP
jgi:hypothetical protein